MVRRWLGTLLILFAVTALTAGCKGGGAGGTGALFSMGGGSSFITSTTTPDTGGGGEVGATHAPEPASMLLWGVGLAGAALLRKRKK